ncbi:MAG TPA: ribosome biogenesis GTPase YlqF [Bacillota bacterium]|nr:ribosome biogenesis GTPase YlqF [Bacillota bacterium]
MSRGVLAGHMAAGERALRRYLADVDVVWELCDARCPRASRNPRLRRLVGNKARVLLLGKADLAPAMDVAAWVAALAAAGEHALAIDATSGRGLQRLWAVSGEALRVAAPDRRDRGAPLRAMVVGVPNVGKSTLLNRVGGRRRLAVGARPGVTRGPQWIETPAGRLLDLPGILQARLGDPDAAWRLAAVAAVDAEVEPTAAALLRWLVAEAPRRLEERYGLADEAGEAEELLAAIAAARGMRAAGGALDVARAAAAVLADFRRGNLGAVALEHALAL